jgi:calcineurin-like phosphoesterase family protein
LEGVYHLFNSFEIGIKDDGHVHNGSGNPGYMEQFRQLGKRTINVGVDARRFHPVSIEEIIRMADE